MPTISDLSDDPKYTIKKVSAQTGIRPVTLRAWERRYSILIPHRSGNRYRLYSDRDVAILRWLLTRMDAGLTISAAATELRKLRQTGGWAEIETVEPPARAGASALPPKTSSSQLYRALIKHDERLAGELFREAQAGYDLKTLVLEIVTPCLVEIGEAWYRGEASIATEHFASTFLRGKLLALLQGYQPRRSGASILVGAASNEQHEIGSLMLALLLRSEGYSVEFLGPDLPLEDLVEYARHEKPAMIILAATTEMAALGLRPMQGMLSRLRQQPIFAYGGRAFNLHADLREKVPGVFLGEAMDIAVESVNRLLGR